MRLTLLGQLAKSAAVQPEILRQGKLKQQEVVEGPSAEELGKEIERVKWFLWHGNVFGAKDVLADLIFDLDNGAAWNEAGKKLLKAVREFSGYIRANERFIVNYGDRYRNGAIISSAFVESTVNEVISKRMEKKQQMRWTKAGAHRLLQVRIQVLDGKWRQTFERWYPGMHVVEPPVQQAA